jgi:hypothetical protein
MSKQNSKKSATVITITNNELVNSLLPSLHVLGTLKIKNIDALVSIAKFRKEAQEQAKIYADIRKQISEEDCEKDKNGQPVFDTVQTEQGPQQFYRYKTEDLNTQMRLRVEQLNEKKIEISYTPIKSSDLKNVEGVTANMIVALNDFIQID